jgi:histidinol-phosphate aminotransferase
VLRDLTDAAITRYPSVYADRLRRALADLHGVDPANISTGCGSDDVIDSTLRAFTEPGDVVAYPDPTFGMVPVFARMNALRPLPVPLAAGPTLEEDALLAARAAVTYICRPNNPTGTAFDRAGTERVARGAPGLVLVDEAYADFADDDLAAFAAASDRTIVLRTFSKAYGLAGLRVGYAIGPAELIAEVEKSRGPYKVAATAEAAALAVLAYDTDWVRARSVEVRANRTRLVAELEGRGIVAFDSAANFVLFCVDDAAVAGARLRERGVAVRPFTGLAGIGACMRVSVGPWSDATFLTALDEVCTMTGAHEHCVDRLRNGQPALADQSAGGRGRDRAYRVRPRARAGARRIVLPGVGAFGAAALQLAAGADALRAAANAGTPVLGICLGMQLLFEGSEEGTGPGLGLLGGYSRRLTGRRLPHMGWNEVAFEPDPLFAGLDRMLAYYANSYVVEPADESLVIASTRYGRENFPAAIRSGNVWGVQFHPEKSGRPGLRLIRNFLDATR